MSPEDVVIGGPTGCFTVTGLKVMSTRDALTIFEACRRGILPQITRRLTESEKQQITAGTIVVFDEKRAKMKRWTDGRMWTPSRIVGNFLMYRELDRKVQPNQQGIEEINRLVQQQRGDENPDGTSQMEFHSSNKGLFFRKPHGLIKRTISLSVPDDEVGFLSQTEWKTPRTHQQHLIAYFKAETCSLLASPDDMEELHGLRLPLPILRIQRFRRPIKIEMYDDAFYDIYDTEDEEEAKPGHGNDGGAEVGRVAVSDGLLPSASRNPQALSSYSTVPSTQMPLPPVSYSSEPASRSLMLLAPPPPQPPMPIPPVVLQPQSMPLSTPIADGFIPFGISSGNYQVGPSNISFPPTPLELQPPESVAQQQPSDTDFAESHSFASSNLRFTNPLDIQQLDDFGFISVDSGGQLFGPLDFNSQPDSTLTSMAYPPSSNELAERTDTSKSISEI
ncbi:Global transcription regulator sge1 [Coemansia sp. RSA 989]|nr:Global transcription regulator sge1 [Coemansia sp. RSA 1086]KAJ1747000.1 Global transcription regulator sge1 [Coemansia sp. RSA 1821]KAJ1860990.1 Global transcription regulator sge1 [Coemansia sp. RSA 989]KAJ1869025.1 Global transcription regulator sge1 [Coemansia sp. RSA 990]KAJ2670156.1 Global transcription regulator sge1 [Coemansia sp. RSA 1085]